MTCLSQNFLISRLSVNDKENNVNKHEPCNYNCSRSNLSNRVAVLEIQN